MNETATSSSKPQLKKLLSQKHPPAGTEKKSAGKKNAAQLQFEHVLRNNKKILRFIQRIQTSLLSPGVPKDILEKSGHVLQPSTYDEVVDERATSLLCGWPCCVNAVESKPGEKYHISWKDRRVYDAQERNQFCCAECATLSGLFKTTLSEEPVVNRQFVMKTVTPAQGPLKEKMSGSVSERPFMPVPPVPAPTDSSSQQIEGFTLHTFACDSGGSSQSGRSGHGSNSNRSKTKAVSWATSTSVSSPSSSCVSPSISPALAVSAPTTHSCPSVTTTNPPSTSIETPITTTSATTTPITATTSSAATTAATAAPNTSEPSAMPLVSPLLAPAPVIAAVDCVSSSFLDLSLSTTKSPAMPEETTATCSAFATTRTTSVLKSSLRATTPCTQIIGEVHQDLLHELQLERGLSTKVHSSNLKRPKSKGGNKPHISQPTPGLLSQQAENLCPVALDPFVQSVDPAVLKARISRLKAVMSPFGAVMTALLSWASDLSAGFITRKDYGRHSADQNDDYEDSQQRQVLQSRRSATLTLLSRTLPTLQRYLSVSVPEAQLTKLVFTFNFNQPVPQLAENQWGFVALVLVRAVETRDRQPSAEGYLPLLQQWGFSESDLSSALGVLAGAS